ncbi:MAPEG family protein [Pseudoalteromonas carrageenovora]|uniref:MAPEG family protein n=1 Tax=Pseudoalteromonas carrageenovora TaxID=227 RepID=UPI00311E122D
MERIIILAMFAQVTLSLVVMIVMGKRRITATKNKQLNLTDFKTMQLDKAGDTVRVADRNFSNQFEIPVLFYAGCLLALQLNSASYLVAALACLFVVSRIVHTIIHLGNNNVRARFNVFLFGCGCVFVIWLTMIWRIMAF